MRTISWLFLFSVAAFAQQRVVTLPGAALHQVTLPAGATVEVSAGIVEPSKLPSNARIAVEWAGYRKILHALDPDFYLAYRAPKNGTFALRATIVEDEASIFNLPRWRESGSIQKMFPFPQRTPWPPNATARIWLEVKRITPGVPSRGMHIELEPNDSISEAQPLTLGVSGEDETLHITGGADDLEYFDNGLVGKKGDDWFRLEYKGRQPRLFTANLTLPDPFVVAQLQMFTADGKEFREGANPNERVHQQLEAHRTAITRIFQPGGIYYLRVESNSPGYEVELRIRKPAPHTDPRYALKQAMYDHSTQVHAWLLNRPRGAAVERRIRDTGSLLGTHCMSCHTQSGVWGPIGAMQYGYQVENVANLRQLINLMYECLRPTNELRDAANNTSLAPLDLGDGPAGTRVAGFNVVMAEKVVPARRLHAAQQQRTANFVLQSADPSGVNAAGPGSNVGAAVVFRFAGAILRRAWEDTGDPKYLAALEEKAEKILKINVRYADDLANRILFVRDVFPASYLAQKGESEEAKKLIQRLEAQVVEDERRLRALQKPEGYWGFDPGRQEAGKWVATTQDPKDIDPAPTALALTALAALGYNDRDPAVQRGVEALLKMQDPNGRWNRNALTGFVTTAYAEHALARLYPETPRRPQAKDFQPAAGESLSDTVARFRALAQLGLDPRDQEFLELVLPGASHPSPWVRYWAQIALGALHDERGVPAQIRGLGDPVKMVREAARWGMRQTLLDDKGWDYLFAAYDRGDDRTREAIAGALVMRADAVMPRSNAGFNRLGALFDRMMNQDPHPGVRAWGSRAAWNWWVWNPPLRERINEAVLTTLEREEPIWLVEEAKRYQLQALFIANGQRANPSKEHQYPQLSKLFERISQRLDQNPPDRLVDRLVGVAGTFYSQAGGDGGPGQMGYVTEHASAMIGKAVLKYWQRMEAAENELGVRLAVESAANVLHDPLQKRLLDFSSNGPEALRTLAATSLADPRVITLPGTQEFLEPLMEQVHRGAAEPERRTELVGPILKLFSRARWNLPKTEEQQRIFYQLLIPKFSPERGQLPENTRIPLQMEKDSTDWYLARSLAGVVHTNPDLQTDMLVKQIPASFPTRMDEAFWLPSLSWLLHYGLEIPDVGKPPAGAEIAREQKERLASLYVSVLEDSSRDPRLRNAAMSLAPDITLRTHPKIAPALKKIKPEYFEDDPAEVKSLNEEWRKNWEYFERWVAPEIAKPNRDDQLSCLGCHAVPGRVPSMELAGLDASGYMPKRSLWKNYQTLIERVNETNVETSKLLRKPLNVQSGKEDGHQGGVRFRPNDRGYEILRRWVLDVARLKLKSVPSGAAAP
ncbi:MAG: HEAT repeat domain-containing protein [Bryobacteraceae bacterium]|nr:HEAT repeat domain-containing protein [Bryobacteraceae bacterium]MDW8378321.1 HEAT repeat domain-containing protein [Bryobacterales bacterium]